MILVLLGPSGSGKTEVASALNRLYGYKIAKSYTTREKRSKGEDNHYFVSKNEYDALKDKVIPVCYDNNYYCYTKEELENSDIIIAEPSAIDGLIKANIKFAAVYFDVPNNVLIKRMKGRGDSDEKIVERLTSDSGVFKNIRKSLLGGCYPSFVVNNLSAVEETAKTIDRQFKIIKNKEPFRLLVDLDDTLENLTGVWLSLLTWLQRNNPSFVPKTVEDLDSWNLSEKFPMLTVDEVFEPLNTDLIWKQIRPLPGAVESLKRYNDMPMVEVRILTSSHYSAIAPKREFLRKYFPFINWNQVIITSEKKYVKGDVLVDDYENNLIGGDYKGVLFYQPHNRFFDTSGYPIIRAADWAEVTKIIDEMIRSHFDI